MNLEQKTKWVGALRSNNYVQCQGELRSNGSFCALGVYIEIHDLWDGDQCKGSDADEGLPYSTLTGYQQGAVISLNDDEDAEFDEIADWIEENVKVQDAVESSRS